MKLLKILSNRPAILLLGAALRLSGVFTSSIWYDESYSLALSRLPWLRLMSTAGLDFNPPLWELLVKCLGSNIYTSRLACVACSIAALWLLGKILDHPALPVEHDQANAALAMAAVLPYLFWVAQDARPYALLVLLYLAVFWFALEGRWLGFTACIGLLFYVHNAGMFYGASAALAAHLVMVRRPAPQRAYPAWLLQLTHRPHALYPLVLGLLGALAALPWLPAYLHSTQVKFWLPPLTFSWMMASLAFDLYAGMVNMWIAAGASFVLAGGMLVGILRSMQTLTRRGYETPRLFSLMIYALGPLGLMLGVSLAARNLVFYRPITGIVLPLCGWLAAVLLPTASSSRKITRWIFIALASLAVVSVASWNTVTRGGGIDQAAKFIQAEWHPGDIVYHATATTWLPYSFYQGYASYLLDEDLDPALLQTPIQTAFNIPKFGLGQIQYRRAWIIYARDPVLTRRAYDRMAGYIQNATLINRLEYFQAAPIEIYLLEGK